MATATNKVNLIVLLYLATTNLVAGLSISGYHQNTEAPVDVGAALIIDYSGTYYEDMGPYKAIDGDLSSYWNPKEWYDNWYITFVLDTRYTVTTVNLVSEGDTDHDVTSFKLEVSDDNVNWYLSGSKTGIAAGSSSWQSFDGFTATGKYLRFTITSTYNGFQPYLYEVSFNGYPHEPTEPSTSLTTTETASTPHTDKPTRGLSCLSCADCPSVDSSTEVIEDEDFSSCVTTIYSTDSFLVIRAGSKEKRPDGECLQTNIDILSCWCSTDLCNDKSQDALDTK